MGGGSFDLDKYSTQASAATRSETSGFDAKTMCDEFNPAKVGVRFSKKSPFNQFKDPITVLVGLDVTGSMDVIPKSLMTGKLGDLMLDMKREFSRPNENIQISFAGIGDAKSDQAPLQVTHFESDNRFAQQLPKIWLEGHGGANGAESYNLLWWYAANKTHLNYTQSDARKGVLITIGDDNVHPNLTANEIQMWLDPAYDGGDISNQLLLKAVREQYEVYHIIIKDGYAYKFDFTKRANKSPAQQRAETKVWQDMLGRDHVISTMTNGVADAIAKIVKSHRPTMTSSSHAALSDAEWAKEKMSSLTNTQWQEVLSYTLCPLSKTYMSNPVVWGDNKRAYEKEAVLAYVREHRKDPITGENLTTDLVLRPNSNIAQLCLDYKPYYDALPTARLAVITATAFAGKPALSGSSSIIFSESGAAGAAASGKDEAADISPPKAAAGAAAADDDQLETILTCPITQEVMREPVMLGKTGQTYEKSAIEGWLAKNNTDPITRTELEDTSLSVNYALKSLCDRYHEQHPSGPAPS